MSLDPSTAYQALRTRDVRQDGRLFVGVTSTGVYCRPVCRVRLPRPENCRFFSSPAQAEAARFRPCLKCRPEIAPCLSTMDSSRALADAAARRIEHALHEGTTLSMQQLAAQLGVTDRHLRRIFAAAHGVTPVAFLNTRRLLLAKQLLTDTEQPITEVALNCGFGSLRRFNAAFVQHYRLNPTQLRQLRPAQAHDPQRRRPHRTPTMPLLRLAYRPPLDGDALLAFFAQRAMAGVEQVEGSSLRRTLQWPHQGQLLAGWLVAQWTPDRHEVRLQLSDDLLPAAGSLMQQVRHWLDLDADPALSDAVLQQLPVPFVAGTRLPGSICGFETAVRVILGQQVTVKAARTLVQRLLQRFGTNIKTPFEGLHRLFPSAAVLADAEPAAIGELGIVRQRVAALQALSRAVCEGRLLLRPGTPLAPTLCSLLALPGVGAWTAQVIALRVLGHADAWPASDLGLMNALGTRDARAVEALAESWRPWRGYAVARLWHHLETGT
jgi:AraC family transcriptional regulator, regulatory protein of adaptative response / DNA-3-methyladenine glycosylase II